MSSKRVEGRNTKRFVVTLGEQWRQHTGPVDGLQFVGTVQRGMHIGALGRNISGQYFAVNNGRWKMLTPRKIEAALAAVKSGMEVQPS